MVLCNMESSASKFCNWTQKICFLVVLIQICESFAAVIEEPVCIKNDINLMNKSLVCTNVETPYQIISYLNNDTEELYIQNSVIRVNDHNNLEFEKINNLRKVTIRNSHFTALQKWLESLPNLEHLTIVESYISNIFDHHSRNVTVIDLEIGSLKNLKQLEISNCNISNIEIDSQKPLPSLNLSNNRFECGTNFTWLLNAYKAQESPIDLNNTVCFMKKINNGPNPILYSLRDRSLLTILKYKREASVNCPAKCSCVLIGMILGSRPILNLDCIGLNMTSLPDVIPLGTSRCNFSYNLIEDLGPLYSNKLYDSVAMVILSHNHISYLDPVKFSKLLQSRRNVGYWFDHNKLTQFPAEAVKKVYSEGDAIFVLSNNPWICSCDYLWHFQDFIYSHSYDIMQGREIRCAENDPNSPGESVLTLDVGSICSDEPLFVTLDLINLFLALILLVLVADFGYNYRQYRKHRKLPWIITKF